MMRVIASALLALSFLAGAAHAEPYPIGPKTAPQQEPSPN